VPQVPNGDLYFYPKTKADMCVVKDDSFFTRGNKDNDPSFFG